eukprot:3139891-Alexandrium_andersonii.AAC.1
MSGRDSEGSRRSPSKRLSSGKSRARQRLRLPARLLSYKGLLARRAWSGGGHRPAHGSRTASMRRRSR